MEGRIRSLLLSCIYIVLVTSSISAQAEDLEVEQVSKPVIQPNIERMDFEESKIEPNNFEIIGSFGILSIEDFGSNPVIGAKLAYRVSENFFVDFTLGRSSAGDSGVDTLFPGSTPILSNDEKDYSYYLINLGYDLFPSESFVTNNTTLNTAFYVIAGAGNTTFAGKDNFTFSFGYGYRVIINHYLTAYIDVRDHTFELSEFGVAKRTNNIEMTLGVGFYY